jgi:GNAT superfamily N-acetyltransferase
MYTNCEYKIVGYTALTEDIWETPAGDQPMLIIPAMALRKEYWGQPADAPKEWRYSSQMIEHVIRKAQEIQATPGSPTLLGLIVHPRNTKAVQLYKRHGFEKFSYSYTVPGTRKKYESYVLALKSVLSAA